MSALGRPVTDYVQIALAQPTVDQGQISGEVVRIDRFGNVVTNIDRKLCERLSPTGEPLAIVIGGFTVARFVSTFSEIAAGEVCALYGSTDHLEFAAHAASAAEVLGVAVGAKAAVQRA